MNGIVFEIIGKKAVIMQGSGEFLTVRAREGWRAGDMVSVEKRPGVNTKSLAVLAAGLLLFIVAGVGGHWFYFTQTSTISMDVNPSIELGLNRFDRVVEVYGLSPESQVIMSESRIRNKDYKEAFSILLQNEKMASYISGNSYVYFTVQSGNQEKEEAILAQLQGEITSQIMSHHGEARVECYSVSGSFVEEAHHQGITAGKYRALLELKEAVPDVDMNAYCHRSIGEIKEEIEKENQREEEKELEKEPDLEVEDEHGHKHGECNR